MDKTKQFIEKARKIHGDKYDYSKVNYVNNSTKVCIICPIHGEFWQRPSSHLNGNGCKKCGKQIASKKNTKTTAQFIKEAKAIHGDKYIYSKVNYINAYTKICIICPIHGEFWQKPSLHLSGSGCPKCGIQKAKEKKSLTFEDFLKKAKAVHGDKYDYSKVNYVDGKTKICIICPIHGEFWQVPHNHLSGQGCKKCHYEKLSQKRMDTSEQWIERAKEIHGDRYDYSKVIYKGYYEKVCIICPIHGEFWQMAYNHLQGKGCPKCRKSKLEIEISKFLEKNNIEFQEQFRPKYLINGKSHLSLDFYLPKYNSAIECQGKQHFIQGTFFDNRKETIKSRDIKKKNICDKNNLKIYYYSDSKINTYFDKVYNNKVELLNDIITNYEKKLL